MTTTNPSLNRARGLELLLSAGSGALAPYCVTAVAQLGPTRVALWMVVASAGGFVIVWHLVRASLRRRSERLRARAVQLREQEAIHEALVDLRAEQRATREELGQRIARLEPDFFRARPEPRSSTRL